MWVYSIAVYGFFSRSISVILILTCCIARYHLALRYAVFILVIILADGIQ